MSSIPPKHLHKTAHTHKAVSTSAAGQPVFAQPQPSPDPTGFKNPVTDQSDQELANVEAVPQPVGGAAEPILTLAQVYGSAGAAKTEAIEQAGQIVFHSVGDTGSAEGPSTQSLVADKLVSDFTEADSADIPSFFLPLRGRSLLFRRSYLLLRSVLRAVSQLSRADCGHPGQSRWGGLRGRAGADTRGLPG